MLLARRTVHRVRVTHAPAMMGPRLLRQTGMLGYRCLSLSTDVAAAAANVDAVPAAAAPVIRSSEKVNNKEYRVQIMRANKEGDHAEVLAVYEAMEQAGVGPDLLTLNCVVEAKALAEGTESAQQMLQVILSSYPTLKPSTGTYIALMQPCCYNGPSEDDLERKEFGDMKLAFSLYHELLEHELAPDHSIFHLLLATCTAAKDFKSAKGIFTEMREKGVRPKSSSYLKYIYAAFRNQKADLAYDMLLSMENEWRFPTRLDYSRMLKQFKFARHAEGKLRCVQGIVSDIKSLGGGSGDQFGGLGQEVLSSLFREAQESRDPDGVVKLAQTLTEAGIKLDRFQQVGVIFAHFQLRQMVQGFGMLIDLYQSGHSINGKIYDLIAEELAKHAAAVDESYYLLESRKQEGADVPLAAVNVIIEACAIMGDLDRAFATWAELDQLGLKPDATTYNALLHTCIRTRELPSGRRLLARMGQDGISPNAVTFAHRCALHIMSREEDMAIDLLQQCRDLDIVPTGKMYVSLVNLYLRRQDPEQAQALLDDMQAHQIPVGNMVKQKVRDALSR